MLQWVQDISSPSQSGTPVKISSPHQFSPFSANPKEFKEKQKAIKENRRLGTTSAGPQSQILDGVTYEEFAQIRAVSFLYIPKFDSKSIVLLRKSGAIKLLVQFLRFREEFIYICIYISETIFIN